MTTELAVNLDVDGPAAPPRANGELVFAEPWESRSFGMAMALYDAGAFEWNDFRDALVARISDWEALQSEGRTEGECYSYYRCWQGALEDVVVARGMLSVNSVEDRGRELAARPAGYDHSHEGHDHDHDHEHDDDHHGDHHH